MPKPSSSLLLIAAVCAVFSSSVASAAAKRRVGVDVSGPSAPPVRAAVMVVLKKHGFSPGSISLSGDSSDAIVTAARKDKLAAVIAGEVKDGGKRAKLRVYGSGGDLIGEGSWAERGGAKKLAAAIKRTLWARVGGALSKAKASEGGGHAEARAEKAEKAEKAEPAKTEQDESEDQGEDKGDKAEEKPTYSRSEESEKANDDEAPKPKKKKKKAKVQEEEAEDEGESSGGEAALTALDVGVGVRSINRTLTWANGNVRGYSMGMAPALGLSLAWYPAAHFRGGWPSNIGLAVSAEFLPGYSSKTSDGIHYPTQENDYWAGVRGRLPLGPVEGALTVGGGQHAFVFRSSGTAMRSNISDLPDVAYTYIRAGLDFRVALPANVSLLVGGGYRAVLDGGKVNYLVQSSSFFPDAKISGLDFSGGLGWRFLSFLEVRGGVDLRRYSITTNASGTQPIVASGTDQTFALWAQLAVLLDGFKGGGGGRGAAATHEAPAEDAEKPEKAAAKPEKSDDDKSEGKSEEDQ
ncbi:MAG TPA: hypothetical protein VHJ20_11495 [Polyangia bacterium]|nr:hypothetical protein [Polyangia bacterium]